MSTRGYFGIGLLNPKYDVNIAGVLRAAGCYGAAFVAYTGRRYKRHGADTYKIARHLPLIHGVDLRLLIPFDCVPVAVDMVPDATPLPEYEHPERAFYILGPEDGTLGWKTLDWCRDIVQVPTTGCMNLAATANVLAYDRMAKQD